jgi:hypothetical protein
VLSFVFLIFVLVLIVCDLVVSLESFGFCFVFLIFVLVLIVRDLVVTLKELCFQLCLLGFCSGS